MAVKLGWTRWKQLVWACFAVMLSIFGVILMWRGMTVLARQWVRIDDVAQPYLLLVVISVEEMGLIPCPIGTSVHLQTIADNPRIIYTKKDVHDGFYMKREVNLWVVWHNLRLDPWALHKKCQQSSEVFICVCSGDTVTSLQLNWLWELNTGNSQCSAHCFTLTVDMSPWLNAHWYTVSNLG